MAGPSFEAGAVIHIQDFEFEDGAKANKYFIVLGCKPGGACLCVKTTSQSWLMGYAPGCHHKPRTYFLLEGNQKNYFPMETWVILSEPYLLAADVLIQGAIEKRVTLKANLNRNITGQIRNCFKESKEVSRAHLDLL